MFSHAFLQKEVSYVVVMVLQTVREASPSGGWCHFYVSVYLLTQAKAP